MFVRSVLGLVASFLATPYVSAEANTASEGICSGSEWHAFEFTDKSAPSEIPGVRISSGQSTTYDEIQSVVILQPNCAGTLKVEASDHGERVQHGSGGEGDWPDGASLRVSIDGSLYCVRADGSERSSNDDFDVYNFVCPTVTRGVTAGQKITVISGRYNHNARPMVHLGYSFKVSFMPSSK